MWIEGGKVYKPSAFSLPSRSNTHRRSLFFVATMSQPQLQGFMDSMNNVHFMVFLGKSRYNVKLWKSFVDCFNCMPVAAII